MTALRRWLNEWWTASSVIVGFSAGVVAGTIWPKQPFPAAGLVLGLTTFAMVALAHRLDTSGAWARFLARLRSVATIRRLLIVLGIVSAVGVYAALLVPLSARWFYGTWAVAVICAGALVWSGTGRFLCWAGWHEWRISDMNGAVDVLKCERCGREKEVCDGKTLPPVVEITPGWQERAEKLRETVRTCRHPLPHDWTREAGRFCWNCGRLLNEDGSER